MKHYRAVFGYGENNEESLQKYHVPTGPPAGSPFKLPIDFPPVGTTPKVTANTTVSGIWSIIEPQTAMVPPSTNMVCPVI
jgi:hypothetical protein